MGKTTELEEEIREEKQATAKSKGLQYIIQDDVKRYIDSLVDSLDNLSNGEKSIDKVALLDAETKGQLYGARQVISMFDKYRK